MPNKVVLLDLEHNTPSAKMLRDIVEHYPTLYLFNCAGTFEYSLEDLTDFSAWVSSGQIVILNTPEVSRKEFEYAVVVGQLMALLEPETHIEVISAMQSSDQLIEIMRSADLVCSLIQVQMEADHKTPKIILPSFKTILEKQYLQVIKKYFDVFGSIADKQNSVENLKDSIGNTLNIIPEKAQRVVGIFINLQIVKRFDDQVAFRKKRLKKWVTFNLKKTKVNEELAHQFIAQPLNKLEKIDQILEKLRREPSQVIHKIGQQNSVETIQHVLFKNFSQIDPVQIEVIHKLNGLKSNKPKNIYELRDLLSQLFPKSDTRLLLKELIEKGYIYWNGHDVIYSHEMYLN